MSISSRTYLFAPDDSIYALPRTLYRAMLRSPADNPKVLFADQRVRCVDVRIETHNRKALCVLGINPYMLEFDSRGALDADGLIQVAVEMQTMLPSNRWDPSPEQIALLHDVALGKVSARRM
jgi:hypothetical protein